MNLIEQAAASQARIDDQLRHIRGLAWRALVINRTIGDTIEATAPVGYMPPEKRQQIVAIFEEILATAKTP